MDDIRAEIKYKVLCPLCGHKILLVFSTNYEYIGYCEFCERKIIVVDDSNLKKDGAIEIILR